MRIGERMPIFDQSDIVKVPFPYTDRATRQHRPALVVSRADFNECLGLLWVLMITSAENRGWQGDVPITNLSRTGLPVASVIRTAKIASIDARDAQLLGKITTSTWSKVVAHLREHLNA